MCLAGRKCREGEVKEGGFAMLTMWGSIPREIVHDHC